jgi:predicted amidohydrolase
LTATLSSGFARRRGRTRSTSSRTFLEKAEPQPFNAALLVDTAGRPLLHHRKVHICDFDSPELACGRGSGFAACDIDTGAGPVRLGLMICMDREYPDAARALSRQGAEIALVASLSPNTRRRAATDAPSPSILPAESS